MVVQAPCRVRITDSELVGVIENISRNGVLLQVPAAYCEWLPRVGGLATVDIELPSNQVFGKRYLRCHGTVVRLRQNMEWPPRIEVGLSISQMTFRKPADSKGTLYSDWETITAILMKALQA